MHLLKRLNCAIFSHRYEHIEKEYLFERNVIISTYKCEDCGKELEMCLSDKYRK